MLLSATSSATNTIPIVSSKSVVTSSPQTHSYTFSGLPIGGKAVLADTLARVAIDNKIQALKILYFIVPDSGTMTITNLRDSIYILLFREAENMKYNQYNISIGDPAKFEVIGEYRPPRPVKLTSIATGLNGDVPYITITWVLSGDSGIYEIFYSKDNITWNSYSKITNPETTQEILTPIEFETTYYIRIANRNTDGFYQGYSNILSILTPTDVTNSYDNLITNPSFEL